MQSLTKTLNDQARARTMHSLGAVRAPKLGIDNFNKKVRDVEYAVRGKVLQASFEIEVSIRGVVGG